MKLKNKLLTKVLISIMISFFSAVLLLALLSNLSFHFFEQSSVITSKTILFYNISVFLLVLLSFVVILSLLLQKKILYITQIGKNVEEIAKGELGKTIEVKGKDELSQLAQNINYMSCELERRFNYERELEQSKNNLITNISHDVRTPLTSIIGYVNLLEKKQYKSEEEEQEFIKIISTKAQRLNLLINELFDYTKLLSPDFKLNMQSVNMSHMLHQLMNEYEATFDGHELQLQFDIEADLYLQIDIEQMIRVYENLLSNIMKYAKQPSTVQVSCFKKENLVITIFKNRVKVPYNQESLNYLTERFIVGEEQEANRESTGLGLSICKKIIELHEGTLAIHYDKGYFNVIITQPLI